MKIMRGHLLLAGAVLGLLAAGCVKASGPKPGVAVGETAPDFTLPDRNADSVTYDEMRTLSDVRGKVVILYFLDYT